jgi:hypothetical protein
MQGDPAWKWLSKIQASLSRFINIVKILVDGFAPLRVNITIEVLANGRVRHPWQRINPTSFTRRSISIRIRRIPAGETLLQ